jgi:hypothetical protein
MVVDPASLGELEDPLITKGHSAALCNAAKTLDERLDLLAPPKPIGTIREGGENRLVSSSRSFENRSSCFTGFDDNTTHPPDSSLLVKVPQCLSRRQVIGSDRCYLFDKARRRQHLTPNLAVH